MSRAPKPRGGLRTVVLVAALALAVSDPASAQLLSRGLGSIAGGTPLRPLLDDSLHDLPSALDPKRLLQSQLDRFDALVRKNAAILEKDEHGAPVVRGVVLAVSPNPQALAAAKAAGFEVEKTFGFESDSLAVATLRVPSGQTSRSALQTLHRLDPTGVYDYDHLYFQTGASAAPDAAALASRPEPGNKRVILGEIDTGVDAAHPALAESSIRQRAFAPGGSSPQAHGTAVASLLVGQNGAFRGAAPGADLLVADVYGQTPAGGSADAIIKALAWLASERARVINMSLAGPPNAALGAVIRRVEARGVVLVAAVGNDGPAAPPAYPASYPGVVAVTGVDARGRVLLEAGHSSHLDFAAPGADMAAAWAGGRYADVRGTSFAAPIVAGRIGALLSETSDPEQAIARLSEMAKPAKGCGRGLVGLDARTPPSAMRAVAIADQ